MYCFFSKGKFYYLLCIVEHRGKRVSCFLDFTVVVSSQEKREKSENVFLLY